MTNYLDFLSNFFENTFKNYGIFDTDYNLIKSNTELFENGFSLESISVYDKNGRETDFSLEGEKYGIIINGRNLTAVTVTPLYYDLQLHGYSVIVMEPYELFGGDLISRKTSGDVRNNVSSIIANNSVLKVKLEVNELYDECMYADEAALSCMKLLAQIINSETILKMFEGYCKNRIYNVSEIMKELMMFVKFSFSTKMTFKEDIQPDLYADIDKEQFVSAVLNLIVNSFRYSAGEEKSAYVSLKSNGDNIVITVDDNGDGIDEEFSGDFIQTKRPSLLGKEGLGLTVAKLFAKTNGGDMNIISKGKNVGTTVRITISSCESDNSFASSSVNDCIKNKFSTLNILLAKAGL